MTDTWTQHVSGIWADILSQNNILQARRVVEVAPGGVPKIGLALQKCNWQGLLYIVEPHEQSLQETLSHYRRLLPRAGLIPIRSKLAQAKLPESIDFLVSNHPLDDMIICNALDSQQFEAFFTEHYASPAQATRAIWGSVPDDVLLKYARKAADDFTSVIAKSNRTLISQYASSFFEENNITKPDFYGGIALNLLKQTPYFRGEVKHPKIANPQRWAFFHNK